MKKTIRPESPPPARRARAKGSYRGSIREAILTRMARGEPLHVRKILEQAGGGSATTVQEELSALSGQALVRKSLLVGRGATTVQARIVALEEAIDAGMRREAELKAQVVVLEQALDKAQANVERLLWRHEESQRELLKGVDDLRQMVSSGAPVVRTRQHEQNENAKKIDTPAEDNGEVQLWKARAEQAIGSMDKALKRVRELELRLHELGAD